MGEKILTVVGEVVGTAFIAGLTWMAVARGRKTWHEAAALKAALKAGKEKKEVLAAA